MADKTIHHFGLVPCLPLKTGQEVSYDGNEVDDGGLELGIPKNFTSLTTGQYSGTTNIVINGKTYVMSNGCVKDNNTGKMWAVDVPAADIGPAANGLLFWAEWTITKTDISFVNATGKIHSVAGNFSTTALCAGRKFTIAGTDSNDGTYTVSAIDANDITTVEGVVEEIAGDTVIVTTVDDLIWNLREQANTNELAGYSDWEIPNRVELESLVDSGTSYPCIDETYFPSTPANYHWTSSTRVDNTAKAQCMHFLYGAMFVLNKAVDKFWVRLVRDS